MSASPILLYDGDCAFCARSVRFLLDHEGPRRDARIGAREGMAGRAILARHPAAAAADSLVWVVDGPDGERSLVKYRALLAIARYLGRGWGVLGWLGAAVPVFAGDAVYDLVARHRHALADEACILFTPAEKERVID